MEERTYAWKTLRLRCGCDKVLEGVRSGSGCVDGTGNTFESVLRIDINIMGR